MTEGGFVERNHGKYQDLVDAARRFVERVERGSILSKRSYAAFKQALKTLEAPVDLGGKCRLCGTEFSADGRACPGCGAR